MAKSRLRSLDIAKGLGIILVVYGHCLRGLTSATIISPQSGIQLTDYVIYTFHMPLFFLISGIFVRSSIKKGSSVFWRSRIISIVYPYFIWSVIQGTIQIVLAGSVATNGAMNAQRLFSILWDPIAPFWFLYALLFASLVAYLTQSMRPDLVLASAFLTFLVSYFFLPNVISDIAFGTLYVAVGMSIHSRDHLDFLIKIRSFSPLIWISFGTSVILGYIFHIPDRLDLPAAIFGIFAVISLSETIELRLGCAASVLSTVGCASLSIYVMHVIVLGAVRVALLHVFNISNPAIVMPIAIVLAVIVPLGVQSMTDKLNISWYLALPNLRRSENA